MTDRQLMQRVKELVDDFKSNYQDYKKLLEADVETKLIEELFIDILGWTKKDFNKQESAFRGNKKGKADYAFKIDGKIVFFLEVKRAGIPLDKEADRQVVSYALSKRVPFAISTNFEELKIFCVEQEDAVKNKFRVFSKPEEYIENFQDLMYLSKESFEKELTIKKAESEGRLKKRVSIDKELLEDLMRIRNLIINNIEKRYPHKYEINERDEITQRIIDRLIFIRKCEDTRINPENITLNELKHLPDDKVYPKLKEVFTRYNETYNSGLFVPNLDNDCDNIEISGKIVKELISYLYESKDKDYVYNFDWIDADILGQVYEQYLGRILAQTKARKTKLGDKQAHRKEQGIYYTPTYVVNYIIKNTLGEVLQNKKTKIDNLKILDPSCGSGSFLIKTFDYLNEKISHGKDTEQRKLDNQGIYSTKTEILKKNIYGVDLDNKATEISKLNLLLKAAEKNRKLPEELDLHILHGNSLINDKKTAGSNAFKWDGDFKAGTFDIIVGNPPWVESKKFDKSDKKYYEDNYEVSKKQYDLFSLFIEKSIKLLKNEGILGFIIPDRYLSNLDYSYLRKFILDSCKILKIVHLGDDVFEGVNMPSSILILKKEESSKKRNMHKLKYVLCKDKDVDYITFNSKIQGEFLEEEGYMFSIFSNPEANKILKRIRKDTQPFGQIVDNARGVEIGKKHEIISTEKQEGSYARFLTGEDINRYKLNSRHYIKLDEKNIDYKKPELYHGPKILIRKTGLGINATLDLENHYVIQVIYIFKTKTNEFEKEYLLGILNSKLMAFYYFSKFGEKSRKTFPHLTQGKILKLPIKECSEPKQKEIGLLVSKILKLNHRLLDFSGKETHEKNKIKNEIAHLNKELDNLIYSLYNLSKTEIDFIEKS
jgi:adenine-specific DNA-methyltransferase